MDNDMKLVVKGGTGEIVEKKSRFIANVFPVESEEEALEIISKMKKKYYDARHNCFAYTVGDDREVERCSDDGEPSGTAGRPMLDVILGENLYNVLVVVTRYFGGTLLGTGGLVRAYSESTKAGIAACEMKTKVRGFSFEVGIDYSLVGKIQYIAEMAGAVEVDAQYGERVNFRYNIHKDSAARFEADIIEKTGGKCELEKSEECWVEV
ncbi:YigZ family protein [Eubacterium xylanophilum]|uniref:YigZ family protein n=1 Tax=Eubacterium xylanophilum TaxID=39497 RepID=UPI00047874BE|nr:YigZ family protein [Eubacterium xylanophilum]